MRVLCGLGGEVVQFGTDRNAVQFGDQKINIHPVGTDIEPVAVSPTPRGGDFCLITDTRIETVKAELRDRGIAVVEGPVTRAGAVGEITSIYTRDPDGNLVEIGRYDDAHTTSDDGSNA